MSSSLLVHCGGWKATEDEVRTCTPPEATESHQPVGFSYLLDQARKVVREAGLKTSNEKLALAKPTGEDKKPQQFFGVMDVVANGGGNSHPFLSRMSGLTHAIGIRGSYDKSIAVGLYGGSTVTICDNMGAWYDLSFTTKQTTHVFDRLPQGFANMFKMIAEEARYWEQACEKMDRYKLSQRKVDHIIMNAVRANALSPSQVGKVWEEFETPSIEEWRDSDHTAWRLYNAFTQVAKGWSERVQLSKTNRLSKLFGKIVDIDLEQVEREIVANRTQLVNEPAEIG